MMLSRFWTRMRRWGPCQVVRFGDSKFKRTRGGKKWPNGFGMVLSGRKLPRTPKVRVQTWETAAGHVDWL